MFVDAARAGVLLRLALISMMLLAGKAAAHAAAGRSND